MWENTKAGSFPLVGLAALIVAGSIAYHYVIYLPEQDKRTREDADSARVVYEMCMSNADMSRNDEWASYCQANPIWQDQKGSCKSLPILWVKNIDEGVNKKKAQCLAELKVGIARTD